MQIFPALDWDHSDVNRASAILDVINMRMCSVEFIKRQTERAAEAHAEGYVATGGWCATFGYIGNDPNAGRYVRVTIVPYTLAAWAQDAMASKGSDDAVLSQVQALADAMAVKG